MLHKKNILLAIMCMNLMSVCTALPESGKEKPNVVIFFTDDQGTLDANCYDSKDLHTPTMDQLSRTGVRFTQAYSHIVCCPARAMLMTGRYPQRSNVNSWTQSSMKEKKGRNMSLSEVTLAEVLRDAGYKTSLFGKWHLGAHSGYGPTKQGFDEFFGLRGGFIDNYNHYCLHKEDGFHDLYEGEKEVFLRDHYFPDLMTQRALQYIDKHKDVPFFMYLAYNIPHYPEQADKKFDERYKDMEMPRRDYAKMISTTDDRMGLVMKRLEHHGITENTIVIFMSDNGHATKNYQIKGNNHKSGLAEGTNYGANGGGGNTGKWRGAKGTFYEGGIRVPAIISYPAKLPQNVTRDQMITAMDLMPTILNLCDIAPPKVKLDGKNLMPVIESESAKSPHTVLHWQWGKAWMVREGDWKLFGRAQKVLALHHLNEPEPEKKNYHKAEPIKVEHLKKLHDAWLQDL